MTKRSRTRQPFTVEQLTWRDQPLGAVDTPRGKLRLSLGVGSGLARRAGDPSGTIWAIGDRGPNLKIEPAIERYGLDHLAPLIDIDGAKAMPRPDIGPTICELRIDGNAVRLASTIALRDKFGRPISGLPIPGDRGTKVEPVFDLQGGSLGADPSGADTEAIVALSDGSFWIADEYAPSLIKVDAQGAVVRRWVPKGVEQALEEAHYPVKGVLPKIASRRRLNRGFEALALSPDERWLYAAFQSALAQADEPGNGSARYARIWKVDAKTGAVAAQFLYPFDPPESFERDRRAGDVRWRDLKICEAIAIGSDHLLVLERLSRTAKVYAVEVTSSFATPPKHLKARTSPSLEQMDDSALDRHGIRTLAKRLVFSTDDASEIDRDLEGIAVLSARDLLLVNDNDFGVEGAKTRFWRVRFAKPVLRGLS